MVYRYRTVKCPRCGKVADKTRTVDNKKLTGSPFRVCRQCDAVYFDSEYNEPALLVYNDNGGEPNFWTYCWLLVSNGVTALMVYLSIKDHFIYWFPGLIFLALAIFFDVGFIRYLHNRAHSVEYHQGALNYLEGKSEPLPPDVKASMLRLSNKQYLDALRKHGITVPEYFYDRLQKGKAESKIQVPETIESVSKELIEESEKETKDLFASTEEKVISEIVFCRKCGARIPSDSNYCPKCGEKIIDIK